MTPNVPTSSRSEIEAEIASLRALPPHFCGTCQEKRERRISVLSALLNERRPMQASHSDILYWQGELDVALHVGINGSSQLDEFVQTTYLQGTVAVLNVEAPPDDELTKCMLTIAYQVRRESMTEGSIALPETIDCRIEVPVDNNGELVLTGINFLDGIPSGETEDEASE